MNNLIRLVEGRACVVRDDRWQRHTSDSDAQLVLPLEAWRERQ